MLTGRAAERRQLQERADALRAGAGGAFVVRGEPGVGKTALLDEVVPTDLRVLRMAAVEVEQDLPFAALHQLCRPLHTHLDRLPEGQREALRTAFGVSSGPKPDRSIVGLAVLGLLRDAAQSAPLMCVVDNAQWLDDASAGALAFAGQRLHGEPVLLVFAGRAVPVGLRGLTELIVGGLSPEAARSLLDSVVPWPLDDRVRSRIVAETRGNPSAILELRASSAEELAGGFGLPARRQAVGFDEQRCRQQIEALPARTRLVLVLAAAEPLGDAPLTWRAAAALGLTPEDAVPAQDAGLIELGDGVAFRHPQIRSTAYRYASASDQQGVHAALAQATDATAEPDRWAWHRSHAVAGLDAGIAGELERWADRARERGGLAAAAAFLQRSVELTEDPGARGVRALAAARAKRLAGAPDIALRLAAAAKDGPLDDLGRADVERLRAEIAFSRVRGDSAAVSLFRVAKLLQPLDSRLAREAQLDALWAARFAGRLARGVTLREVGRAALASWPDEPEARASDHLLLGAATAAVDGYVAAVPTLRAATAALSAAEVRPEEDLPWLQHATIAALDLWDDEAFARFGARHAQAGLAAGAVAVVPVALSAVVVAHLFAGRLDDAAQVIDEIHNLTDAAAAAGTVPLYGPVLLAAWRGRAAEATALIDESLAQATARGEGVAIASAHYARAVLCNGLGRYAEALAASVAGELPDEEGFATANLCLVELIEAAVRTGSTDRAEQAVQRLAVMANASGTEWALGNLARCRALVTSGPAADVLYAEALEHLGRTTIRTQLARTHLLYGEWLRRENRRVDARGQLRTAHDMFTEMGLEAYAERANRELLATGETVSKRTVDAAHGLTAQEAEIARLAGEGLTNPEIAGQLYISARTVEWHLRKVFAKVGVTSRKGLSAALPDVGLLPAGQAGRDLLQHPAVAVRVAERGPRAVAAPLGIRAR